MTPAKKKPAQKAPEPVQVDPEHNRKDNQIADLQGQVIKLTGQLKEAEAKLAEHEGRAETARTDEQAEIERAHYALAALRKIAGERAALSSADVVTVIGQSGVDTSRFTELAAGV